MRARYRLRAVPVRLLGRIAPGALVGGANGTLLTAPFDAAPAPIAQHYAVTADGSGEVIIPLIGYDVDGDATTARIESLPAVGQLYQLSQVFSDYGCVWCRGCSLRCLPRWRRGRVCGGGRSMTRGRPWARSVEPRLGAAIQSAATAVTGSGNRVIYRIPTMGQAPSGKVCSGWDAVPGQD